MPFMNGRTDIYVYALLDPRHPLTMPYECLPSITFRPFYIGMGVGKRIYTHMNGVDVAQAYSTPKLKLIKQLFIEGLEPIAVKIKDGLTRIEAASLEKELISELGTLLNVVGVKRGPLTNLTAGGDGGLGHIHTLETRQRISKSHLGIPKTDQTKEKLRQASLRTAPITNADPRVKELIRAAHLGKPKTPEHRAKLQAHLKAKTNTPEQRAMMSAKLKGKPRSLSPEALAAIKAGAAFAAGQIWINKQGTSKRVQPAELDAYLAAGWTRGRKLKLSS